MTILLTIETKDKISSGHINNVDMIQYANDELLLRPNYDKDIDLDVHISADCFHYECDDNGIYGVINQKDIREFSVI